MLERPTLYEAPNNLSERAEGKKDLLAEVRANFQKEDQKAYSKFVLGLVLQIKRGYLESIVRAEISVWLQRTLS